MPGSPLVSGDESPPDMVPADDLAPPTPDQSPASGPLQQQGQQQLWSGASAAGRGPNDAALEEATWHRQAAEAEHRHRVAVRLHGVVQITAAVCHLRMFRGIQGAVGLTTEAAVHLMQGGVCCERLGAVHAAASQLCDSDKAQANLCQSGMTDPAGHWLSAQEAQAAADRARVAAHRLALERRPRRSSRSRRRRRRQGSQKQLLPPSAQRRRRTRPRSRRQRKPEAAALSTWRICTAGSRCCRRTPGRQPGCRRRRRSG